MTFNNSNNFKFHRWYWHRHYYYIQGLAKDESTLKDLKVTKGAKIMVVGSTLNDVLSVSKPSPQELQETAKATVAAKEPLSQQKVHVYICVTICLYHRLVAQCYVSPESLVCLMQKELLNFS